MQLYMYLFIIFTSRVSIIQPILTHLTSPNIMNKYRDIFPLRMRGLLSTIPVPYLSLSLTNPDNFSCYNNQENVPIIKNIPSDNEGVLWQLMFRLVVSYRKIDADLLARTNIQMQNCEKTSEDGEKWIISKSWRFLIKVNNYTFRMFPQY